MDGWPAEADADADADAESSGGPGGAGPSPGEGPVRRSGMPRSLRSLLVGCAIAAVLAAVLFVGLRPHLAKGTSGTAGAAVTVGSTAPGFTLPALDGGGTVDLATLGPDRSRPVVLNFFASWCGPCRQETPLLASTARLLAARGAKVQFIGVDVGETAAAGRAFAQQAGITYPVGSDTDLSVTNGRYGLEGEPHTFFINANGVIVGSHAGALDRTTLDAWLHRLAGSSG